MTVDLHPDTVAKAKRRNGDAADRPEAFDTAVNCDQLGYCNGEPLVGESYDGYPNRQQLSNPDSGEFLRSLLEHPKVEGLDDVVDELTGANTTAILGDWLATVEAACDAHGLDVDTLLAKGGNEGGDEPLKAVLGYEPPEAVVESNNPLLVAELYTLGLSVEEVATLLGRRVEGGVREGGVRDSLKEVGLLDGRTRDEQQTAFEENEGRIGGTTFDNTDSDTGGLTVATSDFE